MGGMSTVRVTLLTKPGCHLCDEARQTVERVRAELAAPAEGGVASELEELDILQDEKLARLHAEDIPVVLINGKRHAIWQVDAERFAAALKKAARRPKLLPRRG